MSPDLKQKLQETHDWLRKEYAGIRTGQSTPALLDSIKIESHGVFLPINQVGTVGIEDARTLRISVWDNSQISALEQVIREANLGVSLASDSSGLRVIFPELTAERRTQLLKLAKSKFEEARIAIRSVRDEEMKYIEKSERDGDISEDEKFSFKEVVETSVSNINKDLESLFDKKEAELKT